MIYCTILIYFNLLIKNLIAEPRPFWIYNSVISFDWVCYLDFGNPSGSAMMIFPLIDFMVHTFIIKSKMTQYKKFLLIIFLMIFIISVPFSRIYLGG